MKRKDRSRREALAAADRLVGPDASRPPSGVVIPIVSHRVVEKYERPLEIPKVPRHVTKKPPGRPRGGMSEAARQAGVPEATYRRRMIRASLEQYPEVIAAIQAAPPILSKAALERISRQTTEEEMLRAIDWEVAVAEGTVPRPLGRQQFLQLQLDALSAENDDLRRRVAELEAEVGRLSRPVGEESNDPQFDASAAEVGCRQPC
jgi:hypothetical protein